MTQTSANCRRFVVYVGAFTLLGHWPKFGRLPLDLSQKHIKTSRTSAAHLLLAHHTWEGPTAFHIQMESQLPMIAGTYDEFTGILGPHL